MQHCHQHIMTILQEHHCGVISFNYTSFAREACSDALYFHGSLFDYVDIENNKLTIHIYGEALLYVKRSAKKSLQYELHKDSWPGDAIEILDEIHKKEIAAI